MSRTPRQGKKNPIARPQWLTPSDPTAVAWPQPFERLVFAPTGLEAPDSTSRAAAALDSGKKERYRLYAYVVMRLVFENHNGNRFGLQGRYADRAEKFALKDPKQADVHKPLLTYLGHNIACVAI